MSTTNHLASLRALRELGYAVAIWSPRELASADARSVEERVGELGNEVIEDLQRLQAPARTVVGEKPALDPMDDVGLQATVFAVTSPGGERHPVLKVTMNDGQTSSENIAKFPEKQIQYFIVAIAPKNDCGGVEVAIPPFDADGEFQPGALSTQAMRILLCNIGATFRPQAWMNDYAVDVDGAFGFNAAAVLMEMNLSDVKEMFAENNDFDCLAIGLAAREMHAGPFEVDIEESEAVSTICRLAGYRPFDCMSNVTPVIWNAFCANAKAILALHESVKTDEAQTLAPAPAP